MVRMKAMIHDQWMSGILAMIISPQNALGFRVAEHLD